MLLGHVPDIRNDLRRGCRIQTGSGLIEFAAVRNWGGTREAQDVVIRPRGGHTLTASQNDLLLHPRPINPPLCNCVRHCSYLQVIRSDVCIPLSAFVPSRGVAFTAPDSIEGVAKAFVAGSRKSCANSSPNLWPFYSRIRRRTFPSDLFSLPYGGQHSALGYTSDRVEDSFAIR